MSRIFGYAGLASSEAKTKKYESTPLVVGDLIFLTVPPAGVVALDAKTGRVIWKYERSVPDDLPICCGRVNRGLAILGDTLFFGSLDGYLVAINAHDGKVVWQTQVAKSSDGYSMTGAPLVVKDSVIVGWLGENSAFAGCLLHMTLRLANDAGNLTPFLVRAISGTRHGRAMHGKPAAAQLGLPEAMILRLT